MSLPLKSEETAIREVCSTPGDGGGGDGDGDGDDDDSAVFQQCFSSVSAVFQQCFSHMLVICWFTFGPKQA